MTEFPKKDETEAMEMGRGFFRELIEWLEREQIASYHAGFRDGVNLATKGQLDETAFTQYKRKMES